MNIADLPVLEARAHALLIAFERRQEPLAEGLYARQSFLPQRAAAGDEAIGSPDQRLARIS